MMCLSRTLLPLPLGPMMTKSSPGRDLEGDAFEHLQRARSSCAGRALRPDAFGRGGRGRSFLDVKQKAGEEVIQNQDQHDGVDDRLGHAAADAARAAAGDQALVAGNDADGQGEDKRFEQRR